ncbi:UDP-glucose 4-epimerase family protein [Desulfonatronum parangueonense]
MNILVTGANGFVGRALCSALREQGHAVREAVRAEGGNDQVAVGEIDGQTEWVEALQGMEVVVHLAGRAHMTGDRAQAFSAYRRVNLEGTENLARQAAKHGVRRLVFVSSVKVNGEETHSRPFTEDDPPNPEDPYGITKWEAEQALAEVAAETGLEITVLRPPLVHGPGVKGNLLRLLQGIQQNRPFPLGAVVNKRSLIGIENLCSALCLCVAHPATGTYLVADSESISSPELVRTLAKAMGRQVRQFAVPVPLMELAAKVIKRKSEFRRLTGSLEVDAGKIQRELGWSPSKSLHEGLGDMVQWYTDSRSK